MKIEKNPRLYFPFHSHWRPQGYNLRNRETVRWDRIPRRGMEARTATETSYGPEHGRLRRAEARQAQPTDRGREGSEANWKLRAPRETSRSSKSAENLFFQVFHM